MTDSICPICKYPKTAGTDGRLTQWMLSCRCEIREPDDDDNDAPLVSVTLCRKCGKRVGEGRSGSFTQFIFRFDTCSCEVPDPAIEWQKAFVPARPKPEEGGEDLKNENLESVAEEPALVLENFPTDRYKPLAPLGEGGSGAVYLSKDLLLKKDVAVKILRTLAPSQLIDFQEEARTTSKLKHRNIVELHDFAVTPEGAPYMVLEYVEGTSLKELIERQGPLPCDLGIAVFKQVCDALSYAHQNNVFHRDIKPSNILLCEDENGHVLVRLIDFGLTRMVKEENFGKELGQTLAGTPLYMSPDHGMNRAFTERSEIYSIGCVMFEALSGNPPFRGESALETLAMHAEAVPPSLVTSIQALSGSVPLRDSTSSSESMSLQDSMPFSKAFAIALDELIAKCLAKNPEDRFQSTQELKSALESLENLLDAEDSEDLDGSHAQHGADKKEAGGKFFSKEDFFSKNLFAIGVCVGLLVCGVAVGKFVGPPILKVFQPIAAPVIDRADYKEVSISKLVDPTATQVSLNASLSKKDLKYLSLYKNAVDMDLSNNVLTDEDTAYIKSPRLHILDLSNTAVKSLKYVVRFETIEHLLLAGTDIDKHSIERLTELPNLKILEIHGTLIDDSAIDALCRLQLLNSLIARESKLTEKGLQKIASKLPGCWVDLRKPQVPRLFDPELLGLMSAGKNADAERVLRHAISVIEKIQGKDSTALASYYVYLGQVERNLGKPAEAKAAFEHAFVLAKRWRNESALIDATMSRYSMAESEKNLKDALANRLENCAAEGRFNGPSFKLIEQMFQTGDLAIALHNTDSARRLLLDLVEDANQVQKQKPAPPAKINAYIGWSYQRLGRIAGEQNKPIEAEQWMKKAIRQFERNLTADPACTTDLSQTYAWTAAFCAQNGRLDEAVGYQQKAVDSYYKYHLQGVEEQVATLDKYEKMRNSAGSKL